MGVSPRSIHLLHVDDEPDLAEVAAEYLTRLDDRISVDTVTSAGEGLERLGENEYDCVVSDYDMPGQNGIEFLEAVRADDADLPFILYTGKGSEEVASEAISAGVTDYLQKESGTDQYEVLANRIVNVVRAASAEAELDETRARVKDAIYKLDSEWQFTFVNERAEELIQRSQAELLGKSIWEEFSAAANDVVEEQYRVAMETQMPVSFEYYFEPLDLWVQINAYPSQTELEVYFREITERKTRQQAVRTTRERYEALIEYSGDVITVVQADGTITYGSPSVERVLGYAPDALVDENGFEYVHPDDRQRIDETVAELTDSPDTTTDSFQYRFRHEDGSWVWLESVGSNRQANAVDGFVFNSRDVTERRQRTETLRHLKEEFETVFETAQDAIFVFDVVRTGPEPAFELRRLNPAHEAISGFSSDEDRGKTPADLLGPEKGATVAENYRRCVQTRETISYRERLDMDAGEIRCHTKVGPVIEDGEVTQIVGVARKIGERTGETRDRR